MLDDPKVQYFITRMLAHGVAIDFEPTSLMLGLVDHLNNCGHDWDVVGDEDGVNIHDNLGMPIIIVRYFNSILSFRCPYPDYGIESKNAEQVFKILLNTVAYITEISGTCKHVGQTTAVGEEITTVVQDDDWSI